MATQIQWRRGTTGEHASFIGAIGEVTVDTTKNVPVVHDGVQAGGYPVLREDGSNSALSAGSLASCALKFAGDPNTGIYSPGADQFAIVTGGVARMIGDATGSITIPGNVIINGTLTASSTTLSNDIISLIVALS